MSDLKIFIDRMLETENLTDCLEDEDADYLINWGIARLREIVGNIEDIPLAGEATNDLMRFMRLLNQIAGHLNNIQQDNLVLLAEYHQKASGPGRDLKPGDYLEAVSRLEAMTPRQAIDYLLLWFLPEENSSSGDSSQGQTDSGGKE